jgi:bacterioferritin-associated ferredoxin
MAHFGVRDEHIRDEHAQRELALLKEELGHSGVCGSSARPGAAACKALASNKVRDVHHGAVTDLDLRPSGGIGSPSCMAAFRSALPGGEPFLSA